MSLAPPALAQGSLCGQLLGRELVDGCPSSPSESTLYGEEMLLTIVQRTLVEVAAGSRLKDQWILVYLFWMTWMPCGLSSGTLHIAHSASLWQEPLSVF